MASRSATTNPTVIIRQLDTNRWRGKGNVAPSSLFELSKVKTMKQALNAFLLLCLGILIGCGSSTTEATTGTVTLDGKPLANAYVVFTPEGGGRPAESETDKNGNFELLYTIDEKGAPPGRYSVEIQTARTDIGPNGEEIEIEEMLPPRYNSRTELVCEVKDGKTNHFDLELTSGDK